MQLPDYITLATIALSFGAQVQVQAAFPGGTEIDYCAGSAHSINIESLEYFRDVSDNPILFMNGTCYANITTDATYAFVASFRFGASPPITAANGSVCGNLTEECPIEIGSFALNLSLPTFPAYYYPAIVNATLRIFNETLDEYLCIEGPLKSFSSRGMSRSKNGEEGAALVLQDDS